MKKQIKSTQTPVSVEIINNKIYFVRGCKVMIDKELAELYEVSTNRLKEQVRRNLKRFPSDFMFELTWEEAARLASRPQFAGLKKGQNVKYRPYAFTEQGVAMLSSVLNSDRAIDVNIQIMRVFVRLKEMMISHKDLSRKIEDLQRKFHDKFKNHDQKFILVFDAIRDLLIDKEEVAKKRAPIGFMPNKQSITKRKRK